MSRLSPQASMAAFALAAMLAIVALALLLRSTPSAPADPGLQQLASMADLNVTLRLDHATTDAETVELLVTTATGQPADVTGARLRLTLTELGGQATEIDAQPLTAGHFQAKGRSFPLAGRWLVEALLARPGDEQLSVPFAVAIAAAGQQPAPLLRSDSQSIGVGKSLYATHCASCHGPEGRGNGEAALDSSQLLPDMTPLLVEGARTDGQLFTTVKNGLSGTAMPGYGLVISDSEIWQLLAFLRTLGYAPGQGQPTRAPLPTIEEPLAVPDAAEPLPPLVFARQGNLWRSDGSGHLTQLTRFTGLTMAQDPALSSDGRLAFITLRLPEGAATDVTWALTLADADGSNPREVLPPTTDQLRLPTWEAGDGAVLVGVTIFLQGADGSESVRLLVDRVTTDGSRTTLLTDATDPTIGPDGRLAYVRIDPQTFVPSLMLAAPDGSGAAAVLSDPSFGTLAAPAFAPDGSRLLVAASGGPPTDERGNPLAAQMPTIGEHLAALLQPTAALAHGAPQDMWVVGVDGSGLRRLTTRYEDEPRAAFGPDGAEITWMTLGGIYRMGADGSSLRRIDPQGDHGGLAWPRP